MFKGKKLYKSTDIKLAGVCAGIAEYIGINANIVRLIYALITLFTYAIGGVIVYIILAMVMPRSPFPEFDHNEFEKNKTKGNNN